MQTWMMEDVPVSDDSRVVYRGRDTAVCTLLSRLELSCCSQTFLFFSFLETTVVSPEKIWGGNRCTIGQSVIISPKTPLYAAKCYSMERYL